MVHHITMSIFAALTSATAHASGECDPEVIFCNPLKYDSIGDLILALTNGVTVILMPIIVLSIAYIGFRMVLAGKDKNADYGKWKNAFGWSLVGLFLVLGARGILFVIQQIVCMRYVQNSMIKGLVLRSATVLGSCYATAAYAQPSWKTLSLKGIISFGIQGLADVLIPLAVTLLFVIFVYGIMVYMRATNSGDSNMAEIAKKRLLYGILILFAVFSLWGFVYLLRSLFIG